MIESLQPLADMPGVDLVMLLTEDGVPIGVPGKTQSPDEPCDAPSFGREDVLAALAASWQAEIAQAVAPLTWNEPQRIVLRCARGTLVLQRAPGALLLVLLARGQGPEEVRLAMNGTLARIERSLREDAGGNRQLGDVDGPPAALSSNRNRGGAVASPTEHPHRNEASSGH